eukprot:scaffold1782_cov414-Prasinococcus_capsulatus_cf.AAC.18
MASASWGLDSKHVSSLNNSMSTDICLWAKSSNGSASGTLAYSWQPVMGMAYASPALSKTAIEASFVDGATC